MSDVVNRVCIFIFIKIFRFHLVSVSFHLTLSHLPTTRVEADRKSAVSPQDDNVKSGTHFNNSNVSSSVIGRKMSPTLPDDTQ